MHPPDFGSREVEGQVLDVLAPLKRRWLISPAVA
jgi:hypothetical protein